ncbi:MAG: methyltransferase domain-containing protein [Nitrospiraceae bacterium]|nr:MAG: methyltransferase domain-containing protein [Nitrospiraceae bacterium]
MKFLDKILNKPKQPSFQEIQDAVRKKYAEVSRSAEGKFKYPTGKEGTLKLGYDVSVIDEMSDDLVSSFCGVGNPFTLGPLNEGEAVLDIGCGAGFDLIIAGRAVSEKGKVCGIDITPEMAEKARKNLGKAGITNSDIRVAGAEAIPFNDHTFDVITSNGVLNLSPLKEKSFSEIYRVLKPGGRLQFADIVLKEDLPDKVAGSLDAWSD